MASWSTDSTDSNTNQYLLSQVINNAKYKVPCRYYLTKKGCQYQNNCYFQHIRHLNCKLQPPKFSINNQTPITLNIQTQNTKQTKTKTSKLTNDNFAYDIYNLQDSSSQPKKSQTPIQTPSEILTQSNTFINNLFDKILKKFMEDFFTKMGNIIQTLFNNIQNTTDNNIKSHKDNNNNNITHKKRKRKSKKNHKRRKHKTNQFEHTKKQKQKQIQNIQTENSVDKNKIKSSSNETSINTIDYHMDSNNKMDDNGKDMINTDTKTKNKLHNNSQSINLIDGNINKELTPTISNISDKINIETIKLNKLYTYFPTMDKKLIEDEFIKTNKSYKSAMTNLITEYIDQRDDNVDYDDELETDYEDPYINSIYYHYDKKHGINDKKQGLLYKHCNGKTQNKFDDSKEELTSIASSSSSADCSTSGQPDYATIINIKEIRCEHNISTGNSCTCDNYGQQFQNVIFHGLSFDPWCVKQATKMGFYNNDKISDSDDDDEISDIS